MAGSSSTTSATHQPATIRSATQAAASPLRTPTDSGRQSALFQRELDRQGKSEGKDGRKNEAAETAPHRGDNGKIGEFDGQQSGEERGSGNHTDLPSDAMTSALFRAAKVSASQAASAPELPAEHLARIAAAIQEMVANGANAQYQLQLPLGNASIQGAILGRDASGNLAIQLIASSAISLQHAAQLRSDLIRRMEQKRLKIASVSVSTGGGDRMAEAAHRQRQ